MGIKLFTRTESDENRCPYRLCQSGVPIVLPFMTQRVVTVKAQDMFKVLRDDAPYFGSLNGEFALELQAIRMSLAF